jgi:hypothetical protein
MILKYLGTTHDNTDNRIYRRIFYIVFRKHNKQQQNDTYLNCTLVSDVMQPYVDQCFLSYPYLTSKIISSRWKLQNLHHWNTVLSNLRNNEHSSTEHILVAFNPLNAEFNPICQLLALLVAHHIVHISRIMVNKASRTPRKTSRSHWVIYEDSRLLRCEDLQRVDSSKVPQKSDIATIRLDKQFHLNPMLKEAEFF